MTRQLFRLTFFFALFLLSLPATALAQQEKLPQNPQARQQVLQALQVVRSQIRNIPAVEKSLSASQFSASKFSMDDSLDAGAIMGRIEGITEADSAWVLAVAAHLHEDPTAWAFGEVRPGGEFVVTGLDHGSYLLMAGADGYLTQYFSHAYSIWEAAIVEVIPNEIIEGIDFFLEPTEAGQGAITGHVVAGDTGEPVPNAQIYAFDLNNPFSSAWAHTNDDGTYELPNLRSGSYYIQAFADGYFLQFYDGAERFEEATTVRVANDEVASDINFNLNRGGTISGTVVDALGDPVAGASLQAYTEAGPDGDWNYWYGWAATDAEGNYTISGLNSGDYIVSASHYSYYYSVTEWYDNADNQADATPVPVILGEGTENINFVLNTPTEFGSIAGNISNEAGEPINTGLVRLESIDQPNFYFHSFAYPNEDGTYQIDRVPVGTYRVVFDYWTNWFYDTIWYDNAESPSDATPVEVSTDEQVQNIDFVVPVAEGVLSGIVTNNEGKPITNAHVQLTNIHSSDPDFGNGYLWAYANTDHEGRYVIEGLPDGEYYASVFFCYFWECTQQWWPGVDFEERGEAITIVDGISNPASVDFELPIKMGDASISGVVNHQDGHPLAGALVSISPQSNYPDSTGNPTGIIWASELQTYTDDTGAYSFDYLPAGTYVLYASYWEEGASGFEWYEDAQDVFSATPITIVENEAREDINFSIDVRSYFGTLAGTVSLDSGAPIERAYVEVLSYYRAYEDLAFWPAEWYGITDASGNFEIENLYEGEYMVSVYAQAAVKSSMDSSDVHVTHIRIVGGEITEIDIEMVAQNDGPAEIGGMITTDTGDVLEVGIIKAIPVTDDGAAYYTAIADESGFYRLTGLPEGAYYIQATAPWHITEFYDNTSDPSLAILVETRENAPAENIDFSLEPFYYYLYDYARTDDAVAVGGNAGQTSLVYGSVKNENGEPLAGATVYVVDEAGDPLLSTETFEDGMYELVGIQPGASYRVKASHIGYESRFNDAASNVESAPALTLSGGRHEINFELAKASTSVSNEKDPELPQSLKLIGNYPNPFNSYTSISFALPEATRVSVAVYDALGREVENVLDGTLQAGTHNIKWNATSSQFPSGLYFYRITTGNETASGSMTLLR